MLGSKSLLISLLGANGLALVSGTNRFGYDCESGYRHWRSAWSPKKQRWCCNYVERGCPGDRGHKDIFDCQDSRDHKWRVAWSVEKKDWCCENNRVWSDTHQRFCCDRELGCHTDESGRNFNCKADDPSTWTKRKLAWCCKHHEINDAACATFKTVKSYDCGQGLTSAAKGWSKSKKDWCCEKEDKGCPRQTDDERRAAGRGGGGTSTGGGGTSTGGGGTSTGGGATSTVGAAWTRAQCLRSLPSKATWEHDDICYCCHHHGVACPKVYYPPAMPDDDVVICNNNIRKYETGSAEREFVHIADAATSKAPQAHFPVGKIAGFSIATLGIFGLISMHRGVKKMFRKGDTSMTLQPSLLATEEPAASEEELS